MMHYNNDMHGLTLKTIIIIIIIIIINFNDSRGQEAQ